MKVVTKGCHQKRNQDPDRCESLLKEKQQSQQGWGTSAGCFGAGTQSLGGEASGSVHVKVAGGGCCDDRRVKVKGVEGLCPEQEGKTYGQTQRVIERGYMSG